MACNNGNQREFQVVQFIELPFEGIDNYVCVPHTWLIIRRMNDQKAFIAYPSDEDPFETRDRVKRKERYNDEWRFYLAIVKYESDTYRDAEYWIETRNDCGPLIENELKVPGMPSFTLNKKLRSTNQNHLSKSNDISRKPLPIKSIKRPAQSVSKKGIEEKRLKLGESAQSSNTDFNEARVEPGSSNKRQSFILQDNQAMECAQAEETAIVSNGGKKTGPRSQTPRTEQNEQALSSLVKAHENKFNIDFLNRSQEIQVNRIKFERSNHVAAVDPRNILQSDTNVAASPQQRPTSSHNQPMECAQAEATAAANGDKNIESRSQTQRIEQNEQTLSSRVKAHEKKFNIELLNSSQEIQVPRIKFERSDHVVAVDPRNTLQSVTNVAASSQQHPTTYHKHPSYVQRSDEQQNSRAPEQYFTHSDPTKYLPTNQGNFKQELLRESIEGNSYDHRPISGTIKLTIPSIEQNLTHLSNPMYQTSKLPQYRQSQPNQQDSQQRPQTPKIGTGLTIKPKDKRQMPTPRGVTKKTQRQALSTTHNKGMPSFTLNKKLRSANQNHLSKSNDISRKPLPIKSIKRPTQSVSKKVFEEKRLKLGESAQSSNAVFNEARVEPGSSNKRQSFILQDNQAMECAQAEETAVVSNGGKNTEPRSQTQRTEQNEQALNSLVKAHENKFNIDFLNSPQEIQVNRIKIERSNHVAAVDPRNILQSVTNVAASSQQHPTTYHKHPSYVQRSDEQQNSRAPEQYFTHSDPTKYIPTNQGNFKQELLRESIEGNSYDHRPTSGTIKLRIPSIEQNLTHLSNPMYQTSELPQYRQSQPNQQDSQQRPQRPNIGIGIAIKPEDKRQMPTPRGATKKTQRQALSDTHNNFILSHQQQLQPRVSAQSTEDNNIALTTNPQSIAASATSDKHTSEFPIRSFYQSTRIQQTAAHENVRVYQNQLTQQQLVDQITQTKSTTKHVDDVAGSPVLGSHLNVMDNACQRDEYMVEETLSITSDSDADVSNEMCTDETPVEKTNNFDSTANNFGCSSAGRPTAAQNPTSTNHQTHPKVILLQQMLDNFAILFTQMGSTLRHIYDMYKNFQGSILVIVETYKKLLGTVEQFNAMQSSEERHAEVTVSASTSNQNQHINDVANKSPEKKHNNSWRFVLPPKYDPHDTRWTLKYQTNQPELVELMPESGIYVSDGELKYCQHVSKDCKSLARRLLPEVFNRQALSVCLTMSEKAKAPNNDGSYIRPKLDKRAISALLNFVLKYGLKCGWNTDLKPIIRTLDKKIQEIRSKYGLMVEC